MKKLNKVLLLIVSLFSFTFINASATTYTSNKKINFKEFEEPIEARGLLKYENKSYVFQDTPFDGMNELIIGDKISYKMSENTMQKVLDGMYPDELIQQFGWENGLYVWEYSIGGKDLGYGGPQPEYIPPVPENTSGDIWLDRFHNEKIYLTMDIEKDTDRIDMYLAVYDSKVEYIKTFKYMDLVKPYFKLNKEYSNIYLGVLPFVSNEEPFIYATLDELDQETNKEIHKILIFDYEGKFVAEVSDENTIYHAYPIYSGNKLKFAYVTYEGEFTNSTLKVTDGVNVETVLETEDEIYITDINGLIVVSGDRNIIYDNEFNLIKEYSNVEDIEVFKEITTKEEAKAMHFYESVYKEVQNGNYLVNVYTYDEDRHRNLENSELMIVENSKKTSISGYIKDKDGNPLKDYVVELHSTPRTYTTDKDGYFKFDNVEEGTHTLIVKDTEGKVLVTRELNVLEGTETKLEDDTLYFNPADKGFNLNIKIDGEKLVVDSVDKGVKEPSKNIIEKLEDVVVPKTFDGILAYILIFSALVGTSIYLTRKNRRIKYTNIK